jgi:hypothetical protein
MLVLFVNQSVQEPVLNGGASGDEADAETALLLKKETAVDVAELTQV